MEINKTLNIPPVLIALSIFAGGLKDERFFLLFSAIFSFFFLSEGISLKLGSWLYFVVFSFLSSFFSFSPGESLFWSFKFFIFYAVYCYFSQNKENLKPYFDKILAGGAAALAVYIALGNLFFSYHNGWRLFGANPNYTSALFSLCALVFYQTALKAETFFEKFRAYFVYAAFFALVLFFKSRACFFAICAAVLYLSYFQKGSKRAIYWGLFFVLIFIVLAVKNDFLKLTEVKSYARPLIWLTALKAAFANPLWGFGPGLFSRAFELFKFPYFDGEFYYNHFTANSHSQPFQLLAELGFPGLFLFLWGIKKDLFEKFKSGSIYFALALYLLLHGLFDVLFYLPFFWLCLFAFLGLLVQEKQEENLSLPLSRYFFLYAFLAGLGFFTSFKQPSDSRAAAKLAGFGEPNAFKTAAYCEIYEKEFPKDWIYPYFSSKFYSLAGFKEKAGFLASKSASLEPAAFLREEKGGLYGR